MRKQSFDVFHMERSLETGKYDIKVIDLHGVVGKPEAVSLATELQDVEAYAAQSNEKYLPRLYWIENIKTGKLMWVDGRGV